MSSNIQEMAGQAAPWRRNVSWWVVLIEGIVALALGLFILIDPGQSGSWLVLVIGAILLFNSTLAIFSALAGRVPLERQPIRLLRGGIGFFVGLLVVLQPFFQYLNSPADVVILAIGLLLIALIGFYGVIHFFRTDGVRWGAVIVNLIYVAFGVLLIYVLRNQEQQVGATVMQVFGSIFTVLGILLVLYGIALYRARQSAARGEATSASPEPASPPPSSESPQSASPAREADMSASPGNEDAAT